MRFNDNEIRVLLLILLVVTNSFGFKPFNEEFFVILKNQLQIYLETFSVVNLFRLLK